LVIILGSCDQVLLISIIQEEPLYTIFKDFVFDDSGLSLYGALIVFLLAAGLSYYSSTRQKAAPVTRTPKRQKTTRIPVYGPKRSRFCRESWSVTPKFPIPPTFIMMGLGLTSWSALLPA
jgi:hypothetical protein